MYIPDANTPFPRYNYTGSKYLPPNTRTLLLSSGEHRRVNVDENWNFCQHCNEWADSRGRFSSQELKPYCRLFQKPLNVKRRDSKEYVPKRCDECLDADLQWRRYKELTR